MLESINQRENKDTSIPYAYNNYLDLASYSGHVGGGKVDWYPQFAHANDSWGIIYHCRQTFSLLHYINLHKSTDFPHLKSACHQPRSVQTRKHSALCLQKLVTHLSVAAKHKSIHKFMNTISVIAVFVGYMQC